MDAEKKLALFGKLREAHAKERKIQADEIYVNEADGRVLVIHDGIPAGEYIWNRDEDCLIRIRYVVKDRDYEVASVNSYQQAVEKIQRSVSADLMGSSTFSIDKIFTTQGVPY